MNFSKVKYNLLIITMAVILLACVGLTAFFIPGNADAETPGGDGGGIINPEDPIVPDNPDEEDPNVEIPSILKPKDLLFFAMDMVYNGKGSVSMMTQELSTTVALGIGETQKVKAEKKMSGGKYLEISFATCENKMGEYFYRYQYADTSSNLAEELKITDKKKFNYDDRTVDLTGANPTKFGSVDELVNKNKAMPGTFTLPLNKNTIKNDNIIGVNPASGKIGYHTITVEFAIKDIPEEYIQQYYATSSQMVYGSIKYQKPIKFEFFISKTTGKLLRYNKYEEFSINPTAMPTISATMFSTCSETYTVMNKEINIEKPVA